MSSIVFKPRQMTEEGRCCGRKPLFYKTSRGMKVVKDAHYFCTTCDAEFGVDGKQRANWAWIAKPQGFAPVYRNEVHSSFERAKP